MLSPATKRFAEALIAAILLLGAADCGTKEYANCRSICEQKKECGTDPNYDVDNCTNVCSGKGNDPQMYCWSAAEGVKCVGREDCINFCADQANNCTRFCPDNVDSTNNSNNCFCNQYIRFVNSAVECLQGLSCMDPKASTCLQQYSPELP